MNDFSSFDKVIPNKLCNEDVVSFLQDNPDFFLHQNALLMQLRIPHEQRGAISLIEMQLEKLRSRIAEQEEEITQLMSIAAGNEHIYRSFSTIQSALFAANEEKDIRQALNNLASSLNFTVDLRLYDATHQSLDRSAIEAIKATHFGDQRIYLGRLRQFVAEQFVTCAPQLGSYALVPICHTKELGFISFASQDGGHFQPSMDTLFIEQLAEHIGILLTKWRTAQ